jgi:porin
MINTKLIPASTFLAAALLTIPVTLMAQNFGGPDAVENTIEEDARITGAVIKERITQPWFDWKAKMQEDHGFSIGVDYSAVGLFSSEKGASGDDNASSGMVRLFGSWDLVGRGTKNTGALVYKVEHRHSYTDFSVKDFGFDQGYVGLIEPPFSDQGTRWTNLYWRQRLNEGRATITAGLLDATDYLNVYALASPWTGFMNFAFSTGSASMFIPNDATFGAAGGAMLSDNLFLIGGIVNAWTDSTDPFETVGDFFSENEYFSSIELGWTRSQGRIYQDNMHITLWHVDESIPAETPGGWGVAFNYSRSLDNDRWMPFVRGGYADEGGTLLQKSLSVGFGYNAFGGRDQLGVAINWGEPNEDSFGPGLDDQFVFETYYRWQLTEQFAITPDIQYLKDPALNPEHDSLWVFGLRGRLAL